MEAIITTTLLLWSWMNLQYFEEEFLNATIFWAEPFKGEFQNVQGINMKYEMLKLNNVKCWLYFCFMFEIRSQFCNLNTYNIRGPGLAFQDNLIIFQHFNYIWFIKFQKSVYTLNLEELCIITDLCFNFKFLE